MAGAYNEQQESVLKQIEELRLKTLENMEKRGINSNEDINMMVGLTKAITDDIHKTAAVNSKHDIGTSLIESAENRQAFLEDLHKQATEVKAELPKDYIEGEIAAELIPTPVPGQLEDGIEKLTLKEIMDTPLDDD